jgi:RNA polymerase-binding transcription factor DksA
VTTSRQQKAKRELERRRAAVLQATLRAEAELDGLRSADRGQEFEEVSQSEQGAADLSRLNEAERLELRRIEAKRLKALPWAIRCADCATARERAAAAGKAPV